MKYKAFKVNKKQSIPYSNLKCLRCGACCRFLLLQSSLSGKALEFYRERGLHVNGDVATIRVDHVCRHLKDDKCGIYEKRPLVCREYPIVPLSSGVLSKDDLPDSCVWKI